MRAYDRCSSRAILEHLDLLTEPPRLDPVLIGVYASQPSHPPHRRSGAASAFWMESSRERRHDIRSYGLPTRRRIE
jgi:hypothetical protein